MLELTILIFLVKTVLVIILQLGCVGVYSSVKLMSIYSQYYGYDYRSIMMDESNRNRMFYVTMRA
jgi:hypothetical protein